MTQQMILDTSGSIAFRPGTAATTAKAIGVLYENGNLTDSGHTSDTSIVSYSLPANVLSANNQCLRIYITGQAVGANCAFNVKWGTTSIGPVTVINGQFFTAIVTITRTGAATQIMHIGMMNGASAGTNRVAPAETLSGAVTIDFRGSEVAGGTLYYDSIKVVYEAA